MWNLETRWFDVAAFAALWAVLVIVFGRFQQHQPVWRRLTKFAVTLGLLLGLITIAGRVWAYGVLAAFLAAGGAVHFTVLSARGINGFTGEPRERLDALLREIEREGEARSLLRFARSLRPRR